MHKSFIAVCAALVTAAGSVVACGSSSGSPAAPEQGTRDGANAGSGAATTPAVTGYQIATAAGGLLDAVPGDGLQLVVLETLADGSTAPLPKEALVTWSGPPVVRALAAGTEPDDGVLPGRGGAPAAMWLVNPGRASDGGDQGVLWVLDRGTGPSPTVDVTATIGNVAPGGTTSAKIAIGEAPAGDATAGKATFVANCGNCHGPTGHGKHNAPGLNAETGNLAADPDWNAAILAIAARAGVDDLGVSLGTKMPSWLTRPAANGKPLTTADFADIYAFLKTQEK